MTVLVHCLDGFMDFSHKFMIQFVDESRSINILITSSLNHVKTNRNNMCPLLFNPFPDTTTLQKILWNHLGKYMKNFYKWKHDYWIELKTLRQKELLVITSNFSFSHNVFKSHMLKMHQNMPARGIVIKDTCIHPILS